MPWVIVFGLNTLWMVFVCLLTWITGMKEATLYWLLFGGIGVLSLLGALGTGSLVQAAQAGGIVALLGFFIAGWWAGSLQRSWVTRFDEVVPTYLAIYDQLGDQPVGEARIEGRLLLIEKMDLRADRHGYRHLPSRMLAYSPDDVRTIGILDDGKLTLFTVEDGKLKEVLVREYRYSSPTHISYATQGGQVQPGSISTDATALAVYPYLESLPQKD